MTSTSPISLTQALDLLVTWTRYLTERSCVSLCGRFLSTHHTVLSYLTVLINRPTWSSSGSLTLYTVNHCCSTVDRIAWPSTHSRNIWYSLKAFKNSTLHKYIQHLKDQRVSSKSKIGYLFKVHMFRQLSRVACNAVWIYKLCQRPTTAAASKGQILLPVLGLCKIKSTRNQVVWSVLVPAQALPSMPSAHEHLMGPICVINGPTFGLLIELDASIELFSWEQIYSITGYIREHHVDQSNAFKPESCWVQALR